MSDLDRQCARRENLILRAKVDQAISIGRQCGFANAADFMHAAEIPKVIVFRLLAGIGTKNPCLHPYSGRR